MRYRSAALGFLLALLAVAGMRLAADTYPRQPGIKILHYTFDVVLSDTSNEIVMQDTVQVAFLQNGVAGMDLDLCGPHAPGAQAAAPGDPCVARGGRGGTGGTGLAATDASTATGMTVTAVTADGKSLTFTQTNDRVHVNFPEASKQGGTYTFTLSYHGVPATGLAIRDNNHQTRVFLSNDWPNLAHNWLATVDHISMKASKTMIITAPNHYQVMSNGLMTEQDELPNNMRKTVWDEKVPIPTWEYSLAVGPYDVDYFGNFHGIQLSGWSWPEERDDSFKGFSDYTQPILEFYIDHIGPYSYEKLAQVEATGVVGGGMELASDIFYGYNGVPSRQLLAHEMAHQYFGNSASEADWDDVFLSEGFATYFALLYQEFQDGHDAFLNGVRGSANQARNYATNNPESTIVHNNLSNISQVIANNAQIYQGGAMFLHALRGVLGNDTFWDGIRLYYGRYQNKNATHDDLRMAMQEACTANPACPADAHGDLTWLFHEWLQQPGILQVNGTWSYDAAAKQVHIRMDQTQTSGLYRMPIQVAITEPAPPAPPAGAAPAPGAGAGGRGRGAAAAGGGGGAPGAAPGAGAAGANAQAARGRGQGGGGRGGAGRGGAAALPVITLTLDQQHQEFTLPAESEPTSVALDPNMWVPMMQATFAKQQ